MPKHDVSFSVPDRPLGKADVRFTIKRDEETLGTLEISNGSVVWFPRSTTIGHKMSWSKFDNTMKQLGVQYERR